MQQHVEEQDLDQYSLGILAAERLPDVEEHLLECAECQARLYAADEFAALFQVAAVQPDARPARSWWKRLGRPVVAWPVAASAMAAAVLLIVSQRNQPMVAPATVLLQALRGPESGVQVAAGQPALLVFDTTPDAAQEPYEVRIVDSVGAQVLATAAHVDHERVSVLVNKLSKGSYWVRLYPKNQGDAIAEYGLTAR